MARITFNEAGFVELLNSEPVKAVLRAKANTMCDRANSIESTTDPAATEPYYAVEEDDSGDRARFRVRTTSLRAIRHEAKTQALQKSL